MRLYFCFLIRQLFPFLYAEVIRPAPTEGKWGVLDNRDYCCFSIKIRNIHSSCATTAVMCCAPPQRNRGGSRMFPKRKEQSTRAVSWQCSLFAWAKIEHCGLNSSLFRATFGGVDHPCCLLHISIFFRFFSNILSVTLFERANKILIM